MVALSGILLSGSAESARPPTIGDLIAACESNDPTVQQEECHQAFQKMYGAALMSDSGLRRPDGYVSCLPKFRERSEIPTAAAEFESKLLAYLRSRPDMRGKPLVRGLTDATLAVYTCLAPVNGDGRK